MTKPETTTRMSLAEGQPQVSEENLAKTTSVGEGENTLALEAQSEALPPVAEAADSLPTVPSDDEIADPVALPEAQPPVAEGADIPPAVPSDEEIADPVTLPDAQLLQALITAIMARNTDQHRPALWVELKRAGAAVTDGVLVLACIRGAGTGTQQSMLANWCNAARRHLMEVGHV